MSDLTYKLDEASNICLSGGAAGSDEMWGCCAGLAGHLVIHFIFNGHHSRVPEQEKVVLSDDILAEADEHLIQANKTLKRRVPFDKPFIIRLLRRNWFQVRDTQRVYAVSHILPDGLVAGGTAWAVQMFIDRMGEGGVEGNLFVYDQHKNTWFTRVNRKWIPIDTPIVPHGVWTGIGSRDLKQNGKGAIRTLLGVTHHFGGSANDGANQALA